MKDVLPAIAERKSIVMYSEKKLSKKVLDSILEAGRWAPSGFNKQPWNHIVVGKDSPTRSKLEKALMLGNEWAKRAPTLIVTCTRLKDQNTANDVPYAIYDSALSVQQMVIQAQSLGVFSHQMGGFWGGKVRKALSIPSDYLVLVVTAFGYESKSKSLYGKLSEKLREKIARPRTRKDISETVFYDRFS